MLIRLRHLATSLAFIALAVSTAHAATWPGLRGADGRGVSADKNLPLEWSESKNVRWSTELVGRGDSSPAVTSDRVYLTSQTEDDALWVLSIERTSGKLLWKKQVAQGKLVAAGPANLYVHRHNPATSSPVADEKQVYAFFGTGHLVCLDRDGNKQWERNVAQEYGQFNITFGMGASPRLWGDRLYLAIMHKGPSYVLAIDTTTGKNVWKTDRKHPAKDDGPDAYSTPVIDNRPDGPQLLVSGSDHIDAYDPRTGKRLWLSSGLTIDSPYGRVIASPVVSDGVIVATSGNPGGHGKGLAIALTAGGKGDVSRTHHRWTLEKTSADCSTPVALDGLFYNIRDDGVAACLDIKTGKAVWKKRISGTYRASLVAGDGKVYFLDRDGKCTVIAAGREGKVLATNSLSGAFFATPAISDGVIYLRSFDRLYAIGSE